MMYVYGKNKINSTKALRDQLHIYDRIHDITPENRM